MDDFIPFALPDISQDEIDAVVEALRSGWLTTGPRTQEFGQQFARATGSTHAVMMNSCTAALHLALEAIGLRAGDEVIVPTMTFAASAEVVRYFGATPVLVDVRPSDHNVDIAGVERAIGPRTRAIIPVHFGGVPCDMDEIVQLARPRGIKVIDDAAHCFPCTYRGRKVGTLGDITCFSFYATKTITTGEGGAATTQSDEWADRMRVMSLHGISKDAWKRYTAQGNWYYEIVAPGYKYNLTDVASAIGLVQLRRADQLLRGRRAIAARFDEAFASEPCIERLSPATDRENAHHLYVIKIRPGTLAIERNRFVEELKARGIGVSVHFIPLHVHPYYRDAFGYSPDRLPVAFDVYQRSISLPIYTKMTERQIDRVIAAVREVIREHRR